MASACLGPQPEPPTYDDAGTGAHHDVGSNDGEGADAGENTPSLDAGGGFSDAANPDPDADAAIDLDAASDAPSESDAGPGPTDASYEDAGSDPCAVDGGTGGDGSICSYDGGLPGSGSTDA